MEFLFLYADVGEIERYNSYFEETVLNLTFFYDDSYIIIFLLERGEFL